MAALTLPAEPRSLAPRPTSLTASFACRLPFGVLSLRFNDLDNIGFTGRHYSGFIMLGIQVFNRPGDFHFWSSECVEFNYRWLTEELQIAPEEITFIEDVWAGGGNLGPSIEYFVGGLELGNMVFMQSAAHATHSQHSTAAVGASYTPSSCEVWAVVPCDLSCCQLVDHVTLCPVVLCCLLRVCVVSDTRLSLTGAESRCRFR